MSSLGKAPSALKGVSMVSGAGTKLERCPAMDAATAAYVQRHDLAWVLRTMDRLLRDIEAEVAPVLAPPSVQAATHTSDPASSHSYSSLASRESAGSLSSSVKERDEPRHPPAASPETMALETTLMLQLLLSSFTPLSLQGAAAGTSSYTKSSSGKQPASPLSPLPLTETQREGAESTTAAAGQAGGALSSSPPPPAGNAGVLVWPSDISFPTKDAAVKAEICRCFAQHCGCLHRGRGLVESCGPRLRWADVSTAAGGHERVGVALVCDVFECWRQVVVPLLQSTGDLVVEVVVSERGAVGQDASATLFDTLVAPQGDRKDGVAEVCSYWCFTLLQGYCCDAPAQLWASILRAARGAAAAQVKAQESDDMAAAGPADDVPLPATPPLTSETLLLRSFLCHLACSPIEPSSVTTTADDDDAVGALFVQAVMSAKARSPVWAWAEMEELQATADPASASEDVRLMSALLRADGYWAVFLQPYRALYAQYSM